MNAGSPLPSNKKARALDDAVIIRPSYVQAATVRRVNTGWRLAALVAFVAAGLAFGSRSNLWWYVGGLGAGAACLFGYLSLYFRNTALFTNQSVFGKVSVFGKTKAIQRRRLARVVLRNVRYSVGRQHGQPEMYFLDENGQVLLSIRGTGWSQDDLASIWRRLGITPEGTFEKHASLKELGGSVPVPWLRRNYGVVTVLVVIIFTIGVSILLVRLGVHVKR